RCRTGAPHGAAPRATVCGALRPSAAPVLIARTRRRVALAGLGVGRGVTAAPGGAWRRRGRPVPPGPRAARWPWMARQHAQETAPAGARVPAGHAGRPWGGGRGAPAWRLMRAAMGGPRPLAPAPEGVALTTARGAGGPRAAATAARGLWR